ncbi:hypothetical protein GCM10009557_38450 [Virgisporangium ochraceum]|uniref:Uncharacterized protein n=1 Tax=Virgisporangium ochraceum TaxID=65505 RepID=A0A8J4ED50_9ACTN|nr:hypothetical protein [Virgisporangium ochraceum]GIJ70213.1 hypothetical protein Voc01_051300 [Virgisporangium ochraceum]
MDFQTFETPVNSTDAPAPAAIPGEGGSDGGEGGTNPGVLLVASLLLSAAFLTVVYVAMAASG